VQIEHTVSKRLQLIAVATVLAISPLTLNAASGTWNLDSNGNWNVNGNWTASPFPNATTDNATLGGIITANRTITLGQNIDIRAITFNSTHSYDVTGNQLTLHLAGTALTQSGSGSDQIDSAVVLANNMTFGGAGSGNVTINGVISQSGGARILTKSGTGTYTLILNGNNTFSGGFRAYRGTVQFGNNGAAGTGTLTISDGTHVPTLQAGSSGINLSNAVLVNNDFNIAGSNDFTLSGNIDLNGFTPIITVSNTGNTTFSGTVGVSVGSGLWKDGTGKLILTGANNYDSGTTVNAGVLNIQNASALGTVGAGTTVISGAALEIQSGITVSTEPLTLNGTGISSNGALRNISGNNTWSNTVTLGSNSSIGTDAGTLTISNVIDDGAGGFSLTKVGSGTLALNANNTFSGGLTVSAGTVQFGNAGGAGTGTLTINAGTIQTGSALTVANAVTVGGDFTVGGSNNLTLSGAMALGTAVRTVTVANTGATTFSGVISGGVGNGFTKAGSGTLTFSGAGANTYSGVTTVNDGTLVLNKSAGVNAIAGNLTIGDGVGAANSAIVQLSAANQIINTSAVTISTDGKLDLNNNSNTIGSLTTTGGNVTTGTGTLTLGGNVTGNASSQIATISGNLALGAATRTFTIASGTTGSTDMQVSAVISGLGGLTKAGAGQLTLNGSANNTFTGATTINAGTLELSATGALNSTSGITINTGGTLLLSGASTDRIGNAVPVTLAGGTLTSQDRTETMGALTMTAASVINLGTDGTNQDLTFASLTDNGGAVVINNWSGKQFSSGSDDRIFLTGTAPGTIFGDVSFTGYNQGGIVLASHELVPIPEPGTVISGILLSGLVAFYFLRRRMSRQTT